MGKEECEGIGPNEMSQSLVQFPDLRQFSDTKPTDGSGGWVLQRKDPVVQWQEYTLMNPQILL